MSTEMDTEQMASSQLPAATGQDSASTTHLTDFHDTLGKDYDYLVLAANG